jgi:RHS repeat-associated protein
MGDLSLTRERRSGALRRVKSSKQPAMMRCALSVALVAVTCGLGVIARAAPLCNQGAYTRTWFGASPLCVGAYNYSYPDVHTCILSQAFYCADGSPASEPRCAYLDDNGICMVRPTCESYWPAAGPDFTCPYPSDTSSSCAARGSAQTCGMGQDDNFDGCIDEGCTSGAGECQCTKQCSNPSCTAPQQAWCSPFNGRKEICGDHKDNNCNGLIDEGCSPKLECPVATGKDPILLASQAAVTEPYTDFEVQFVTKLSLSRTYNSSDVSILMDAPVGFFGRGWHHDWEAELSCDPDGSCTVSQGLKPGLRFQPAGSAPSLDGTETVAVYAPYATDALGAVHHDLLLRRASGRWELYLSDGNELLFDTVQTACSTATPGAARLVQTIDPAGNATFAGYDPEHGVLLSLDDGLGHTVEVRGEGFCPSRASELRFDGRTMVTYGYSGGDLYTVTDADGSAMRSYTYYSGTNGLLRAVRNGAGEVLAEFSYDDEGRAIGLVDYGSSVAVDYDAPGGITVTEAFRGKDGDTVSSSARTLNQDGNLLSSSDGCACGPAKAQQWSGHDLTCSMDALGHVTHHDHDALGRITSTIEFGGTGCAVPAALPPGSSAEYRGYGVSRPIVQGVALDLDVTSSVSRWSSTGANGWAKDVYDYSQSVDPSVDPPGYACTSSPLPAGSVVCRQLTSGYVMVDPSSPLQLDRHATFFSYDQRGRLVRTYGPVSLDFPRPGDVPPLEERTYWPDDAPVARRGRLHELRRYPDPAATPLVTSYDYDELGVYQTTDERGGVSTVVKDGRGRPRFVVAVDTQVTETRYHDGASPSLVLLPGGEVTRYAYDGMGRVQGVEHLSADPDASAAAVVVWSEAFAYDAAGNRIHSERKDRDGRVTWQQDRGFDVQHRVVWDSHPEAPAGKTWTYDQAGFLSSLTDEIGRGTVFTPDARGRVLSVSRSSPAEPARRVATYAYSAGSPSPSQVVGGNDPPSYFGTATYAHDDFGQLYQLNTSALMFGDERFWYDARGNLVKKSYTWGPAEYDVLYAYDGLDRLTTVTADEITYRYAYDRPPYQGLLVEAQEPGRTVTYAYDAAGRLAGESVAQPSVSTPLVTTYGYDPGGRLEQLTYPSGLRLAYDRDPSTGEVVRITNLDTGTRYVDAIAHAPGGPIEALTFGNGQHLSAGFNRRYEEISLSNGPLSLGYNLNLAGDVGLISDQSMTLSGCSRDTAREFAYDAQDRLTGSTSWLAYTYDGAGNRTGEAVEGAQESYLNLSADQPQHRLVSGTKTHSFVYDYRGNVSGIASWATGGDPLVLCLVHDSLGRLTAVGPGSGSIALSLTYYPMACVSEAAIQQTRVRFAYDASNRRIARQDAGSGQWTYFVHDAGGNLLSEITTVNGTPVNVRDYVWLDARPVAQIEYPGPTPAQGHTYYVHTDAIGLPRAMTNASGQLVWNTYAKPYGDIAEKTSLDPLSGKVIVTNLRLPGQYDERLLGSLGLQGPYYNWNRWYLPGVGRYLEPDPIALQGEINGPGYPDWYGYAEGNPLRNTDPRGECIEDACVLEGYGLAVGVAALGTLLYKYMSDAIASCSACKQCICMDIDGLGRKFGPTKLGKKNSFKNGEKCDMACKAAGHAYGFCGS